jgi:hypothetical protein
VEEIIPIPVISNFLAGSLISLIIWWLDQDMPYTPEEMDDMFNALAMPGIWKIMGSAEFQER